MEETITSRAPLIFLGALGPMTLIYTCHKSDKIYIFLTKEIFGSVLKDTIQSYILGDHSLKIILYSISSLRIKSVHCDSSIDLTQISHLLRIQRSFKVEGFIFLFFVFSIMAWDMV